MSDERRFRMAKRFTIKNVLGFDITVPVFDDLTNEELKRHFDKAIADQDFEYCQAVYQEAVDRGLKLKFE